MQPDDAPRPPSCATTSTGSCRCPGTRRRRTDWTIDEADEVLDEDHYGLKKIKERILEYLAVQALTKKLKGPVLCFVGPPGVGKTSLGEAASRARRGASSCACRWAACATRPRSAATGARTSARCRASSSSRSRRRARRTPSSSSTRSTRCRPTSAAIRRRRCSRCSTRSRTTASTTTTSISTTTSPT